MANTVYSASLIMTADVNQAKAQLKDLQQSLNSLMKTSHDSSPLGLTQEIAKATSDVAGLKAALQSATNTNTGKLDLSKFSKGLDAAKLDIKQVASSLQSLGPAGQQAFSQLATSIMSAEVPLKRTNQLLDNFKTTLANTVKWQISSSMVNSLVGAMQHAYGYAQDLNKSLNDIRIVTGYSTDQMSRFAKEANNAAKALSTTTTQYTDAALIYYQQGLAEKDIKARTDATIKMANVTGESAKAVSDYMTAIWNNFDNGSKSIEYYADVMTALGAATASSTDEIAAGLEKFAAVSETVGLSYEYATAALATVTAETRQSADVVGNAFKTLFSRIQGLNLGETMDDGTDLNKYSKALAKVGIDIKDTSGEIKSMNTILDELGAKWGTLSNDTQMALAQAVAGVRQYNQLISLMENWDTFKINLGVAEGAEGELQKQADIYAESWQAAADRVEASFQDIYDSILKDEFFIKLTDFFGGLIDIIGNTIDGIGGMGGAFAALGVIVSRVWGKDIGKAISSLTYNPTEAQENAKRLREETNVELTKVYKKDSSQSGQARYQAYTAQSEVQNSLLDAQARLEDQGTTLTEIEKAKAAILVQQTTELGKQLIAINEMAEAEEKEVAQQQRRDKDNYRREHSVDNETQEWYDTNIKGLRENSREIGLSTYVHNDLKQANSNIADDDIKGFENLKKSVAAFKEEIKSSENASDKLKEVLDNLVNAKTKQEFNSLLDGLQEDIDEATKAADELYSNLRTIDVAEDQLNRDIEDQMYLGQLEGQKAKKKTELDTQKKDAKEEMDGYEGVKPEAIESYAALAEAISMCAMGITSLIGLFDVWNSQDMSFGEKLLTTFTTLGTVLPMIATSFSGANKEMLIAASNSIRTSLGFSAVGASGVAAGAGATAAGTGFGVAAAGLWSLIWPIGLVIAGLTALIGVIYGVSKAIDNSDYTLDEQIENSKQSVDELTTSLEDAKTAAEELGTAFDTYDSAIDKLEECTKGTKEYQDALQAANDAALELIKNNPELDYTTEDGGLIKINPESQKRIEEKAQQAVDQTDWALTKEEYDTKNLELSKQAYEKFDQYFGSAFLDNGQIADLIQRKSKNENLDFGKAYMEEAAKSSGYQLLEGQSFSDESVIAQALGISIDAVNSYAEAINKEFENQTEFINSYMSQVETLRKAELTEATSKVTNYLGNKAENYTSDELTIAGAVFNSDTDKAIQEEMASYQNISRDRVKELLTKYVDDFDQLKTDSIRGTGEDMEFYYKDTEGKTQHISAQTIADLEGAAKAFENIGVSIQNAAALMSDLTSSAGGKGAASLISKGDLSNLSEKELNNIKEQGDITTYLNNLFGDDLLAIANAAGYDTSAEFIIAFEEGISNQETALNDAIQSNIKQVSNTLKGLDLTNFNVETRENLINGLEEAFKQGGTEALNSLTEIIEAAGDKAGEVIELINSYDWETGNAEDFANQLYEITGGSFSAKDAVKAFGLEMEAAGDRIPIDELQSFIDKIHELITLLNDLKIGDIVDEDVVAQLEAQGIAIQDYAIKTYEGWKLINQIPTDGLQQKSTDSLLLAQGAYDAIDTSTYTNGESTANAYEAAQRHLGHGSAATVQSIDVLTRGMSADEKYNLFSGIGGKEYIDQLLTLDSLGNPVGKVEEYDAMLQAIMDLYTQGQSGALSDDSIYGAAMYEEASNKGLASMSQMDQFRDESGEITQAGANALQGFAADDEIYSDALNDYQEALKEAGEDTEAINKATEDFYKRLKKIENTEAAKNIADLQDSMKDMTEGSQEYESAIGQIQTQLEKTFGKEISDEWVRNNQDVIKQWTSGATEAERELAGMEIQNAMAAYEIEVGLNTDNLSAEMTEAMSILDSLDINKQVLIDCVGQGDFSALIGQLTATGASADQVAAVLSAIGSTTLSPEGFAKIAEALKALQAALQDPTNEDAVDAAIEAFNTEYQMAMSGESPNVPPDMQTHTGGGGGGSGKSASDSLQDTLDKRKQRKRELLHLKQEGLDPEEASKYYQEEIEMIEEENKLLEEQIDMYKEQLPDAVEDFNKYIKSKGHGEFELTLNDDGTIANIDQVLTNLQTRMDFAEAINDDALMNELEDIYEALMGPLGLQENIDENVALIAKNQKEQAQLALEDIVNRIDWRVKQIDHQIEVLNYYQEKLLKQAHGNKQQIEAMLAGFQYQEQEMLKLFEKGAAIRQGIDELQAAKAQYPGYEQMFNEQILEYQGDLIDLNMDILELRQEMEELVQNVLDLALDEIDIQTDRIDNYVSMLDRFNNIIDLSGRTMIDQALKVKIGTTKVETMLNKMGILKQQMEGLTKATNEAQDALARRRADNDETSVKFWENQVEVLKREMENASDEFLGSWEETLEAAEELFTMRVELAAQTLSDALSPYSSLELLQQAYDRDKEIREQYLDETTKLYELNKLNRQLNLAIADENDLLAKSKLRDLQEEIYSLQKKGIEMSQFDLDILQKKYDLQLAELALLEAQNSKTSMRLIRDAAGNWTYAYDADEEAIEEATQKMEDALYEYNEVAKQYIDDISQQIIENQIEYKDALMDLDKNSTDYQEQLLSLQEHYMSRQKYLLSELNKGAQEAGVTFHDTLYGNMMDIYSFEDAYNQFISKSDVTIAELMTNYKDWQSVVEQAMNVAGTSWETFGDDTDGTLSSLEDHIQALCKEISELVDVLMGYVSQAIGMVEEWQAKYSKRVDQELATNEGYFSNGLGGGGGGSGGGIIVPKNGDLSYQMTEMVALYGAEVINSPEFQALYKEREKKLAENADKGYISNEDLMKVLTGASTPGSSNLTSTSNLGTDVLITDVDYTNVTVQQAVSGSYGEGKAPGHIDFVEGDYETYLEKLLGRGGPSNNQSALQAMRIGRTLKNAAIMSSYNSVGGNYSYQGDPDPLKRNNGSSLSALAGAYNPQTGWCGLWVGDVFEAAGYDFTRGHASQILTNYHGVLTNGTDGLVNGQIVGNFGGQYGHVGIYHNGFIYATGANNKIERMSYIDYIKHYGSLVATNAYATEAGTLASNVYARQEGKLNNPGSGLRTMELFDTGGYTGEWGKEGRLALLHEKELVLNKNDTSNILDAVKISRSVDDKISSMITDTNYKLRELTSRISLPIHQTQPIEQKVEIMAEFPGVTDQYEIQEAFANLSNDASQYLSIKNKD